MKFDYAIGNPPYNADFSISGDNGKFAAPVYNLFMDAAYGIADRVELIHPARFLFNAGSTPKAWNEKMLNNKHFKVCYYEPDCKKVFSNIDIKGGVAITYYDRTREYTCYELAKNLLSTCYASPRSKFIFLRERISDK